MPKVSGYVSTDVALGAGHEKNKYFFTTASRLRFGFYRRIQNAEEKGGVGFLGYIRGTLPVSSAFETGAEFSLFRDFHRWRVSGGVAVGPRFIKSETPFGLSVGGFFALSHLPKNPTRPFLDAFFSADVYSRFGTANSQVTTLLGLRLSWLEE